MCCLQIQILHTVSECYADIENASNSGSDNIMSHFMWTGHTISIRQCHAIRCMLWFFPAKSWILILIQLVWSQCNRVWLYIMNVIDHYDNQQNSRNKNAGVTVDQHTLKFKYTSVLAPGLMGKQSVKLFNCFIGSYRTSQYSISKAPAVRVVQQNQAHQANYLVISACS